MTRMTIFWPNFRTDSTVKRYGHVKEGCPSRNIEPIFIRSEPSSSKPLSEVVNMVVNGTREKSETYSPWMLVEKISRHKLRDSTQSRIGFMANKKKVGAVKGLGNVDQVMKAITGLGLVSTIELGVNSVWVFQGRITKAFGKTPSSSETPDSQGWTEEGFLLGRLRVALHCKMTDKIIFTP
ncbi:hypothetical protein PVK06_001179 [Gossypium arboreum]|uniref:Uncharacterized protein n=1 Tax=Gossypium arboreum TaxID=29729 RepID=A0ABR0R1I9_GOSAR|nr:hypothetical protein PVK06_001179 [Gossypium arboreum]